MKNINKAFTLIELLVWIVLFVLIALSVANMNFWKHLDVKKADQYSNRIYSEIEQIRNNSVLWKWVWVTNIFPENRKIELDSNELIRTYYNGSSDINISTYTFENFLFIENAQCTNLSWWQSSLTIPVVLTFIDDKISSSQSCIWTINFDITYKQYTYNVSLNTITWIMSKFYNTP